jgi:transposase
MRRTTVVSHLTAKELKQCLEKAEGREQFQRWQTIYMMHTGRFQAGEVADVVGVAAGTVHQWVFAYNHGGPEALRLHGRGGRRSTVLSWEEEEALLEELREGAEQGLVVVARTVRERVERKVHRPISKDYAYDLLHRHGWRKIAPRPQHPQADPARQAAFKKNSRPWWKPPQKHSGPTTRGR